MDWHAPKLLYDRKLRRLPMMQNTWPNFFRIVGEIFAAHQTPVVFPKLEIIPTKLWQGRPGGRVRSKEFRERERETETKFEGEPDKEVSRYTKLRRSEIAAVVAEMQMKPEGDHWRSHAELKKLEGEAIAAVVRWALKERRKARR